MTAAARPAVTARLPVLGAVAVAAAACGGPAPPPPPPAAQLGPALVAALDAARVSRAPWRCAAPDGPELPAGSLTAGKRRWELAARTLRTAGGGAAAIGVIADAGGAAPPTLAALGALRGKLAAADVVLALGGMGATQAELEATLGALADRAPWPIVALPGDLEPAGALAAAVAALRTRGAAVVDGRLVRFVELPGAAIALVPGAGAAGRLVAGPDGCAYRAEDAAAALAELSGRAGVRIAATAEAPRIEVGGEPAGELALTAGPTAPIDVALHGPTTGAATASRAGGRDGAATALTPGTSDATARLPGPRRAPSVGLLVVSGGGWRWQPLTDAPD